jgi:hypothetical protein
MPREEEAEPIPVGRERFGRRVSVGGYVAGANGWRLGAAIVCLWPARSSERSGRGARAAQARSAPLRQVRARGDGRYAIFGLPAGSYLLGGADAAGRELKSQPVTVPAGEGGKPPPCVYVNLEADDSGSSK